MIGFANEEEVSISQPNKSDLMIKNTISNRNYEWFDMFTGSLVEYLFLCFVLFCCVEFI